MADDLDRLLREQAGVVSRDQAGDLGIVGGVRSRVRRGLWQAPHPRVVVAHNGPLTRPQQLWVAALAVPGGVLWGGSAAEVDGYTDRYAVPGRVGVVLPPGSRRLDLPWVDTHWSSRLDDAEVHPTARPRRTRLPRSLLDLAASSRSAGQARVVVSAAAQQGLVTADQLESALDRRRRMRHRAVVVEAVADLRGGSMSVPEADFARIVRTRGLPRPTQQAVRRGPAGRYLLDALWEEFRLCAEVDGSHHRDAGQWEADLVRSAELVASGLRVVRFTAYAVRHQPATVGDVLDRALRAGGWPGRRPRTGS